MLKGRWKKLNGPELESLATNCARPVFAAVAIRATIGLIFEDTASHDSVSYRR